MEHFLNSEEFIAAKGKQLFCLICKECNSNFYKSKHYIKNRILNPNDGARGLYCSRNCQFKAKIVKVLVQCKQCDKNFYKGRSQVNNSKNHFCSKSCAAIYRNKHKTHGNRRSKLERWLEPKLVDLFPNLKFTFNDKKIISSELDIYIPSLNLAFELNGIFHYEPIFGKNKFGQIQENDISKSKACYDTGIDLCVIDTSQQKYVVPRTSQKFLDIICKIITERIYQPRTS